MSNFKNQQEMKKTRNSIFLLETRIFIRRYVNFRYVFCEDGPTVSGKGVLTAFSCIARRPLTSCCCNNPRSETLVRTSSGCPVSLPSYVPCMKVPPVSLFSPLGPHSSFSWFVTAQATLPCRLPFPVAGGLGECLSGSRGQQWS